MQGTFSGHEYFTNTKGKAVRHTQWPLKTLNEKQYVTLNDHLKTVNQKNNRSHPMVVSSLETPKRKKTQQDTLNDREYFTNTEQTIGHIQWPCILYKGWKKKQQDRLNDRQHFTNTERKGNKAHSMVI